LRRIHDAGYLAVVVTNQSGVARGMYAESDIHAVHAEIQRRLAADGVAIDAFYYCVHHPKYTGECACRKPQPGMLLAACRELGIDPSASFMVGDRPGDIGAGRAAGCRESVLVRSGYGAEIVARGEVPEACPVADDLAAAVNLLLNPLD